MPWYMLKIGTKFKILAGNEWMEDCTIGGVYEIVGQDEDDELYFIDDAGDKNFGVDRREGSITGLEILE